MSGEGGKLCADVEGTTGAERYVPRGHSSERGRTEICELCVAATHAASRLGPRVGTGPRGGRAADETDVLHPYFEWIGKWGGRGEVRRGVPAYGPSGTDA